MGLIGIIGKVAGSKVVEKVEDELTKRQNREQTSKYCDYMKNNIVRINKFLGDLKNETGILVDEISVSKGFKFSLKEAGKIKNIKKKAKTNLQYLYLSRDFFALLTKNASGIILQNEEMMLIKKFAPYFDGAPVLDLDEEKDDSIVGALNEIKEEFMSAIISNKKSWKNFTFEDYLCRYEKMISEYEIPDVDGATESFIATMANLDANSATNREVSTNTTNIKQLQSDDEIECPSCHIKLDANSKFCNECGTKIEIKRPAFCSMCGNAITGNVKFCANCGNKL